jgi:hypothetical protein
MKKMSWLLRVVGMIQIVLGTFYMLAPNIILQFMGHTLPNDDLHYPLAMLASRFVAYGIALLFISANPQQHRLWIYVMVLIQVMDLGAGAFYTSVGTVDLAISGFPMFNAAWISILLLLWMPRSEKA